MSHQTQETAHPVVSTAQWAATIAADMDLDGDDAVERVIAELANAGVRPGGPTSARHRLRVAKMFFAGFKWLGADHPDLAGAAEPVQPADAAVASSDQPNVGTIEMPFAFAHTFGPGITAFATDGENLCGKSTILGILLWALRGDPQEDTLPTDVRDRWLREAAVMITFDGDPVVIWWSITDGRPAGGIWSVKSIAAIDVDALRRAWVPDGSDDTSADERPGEWNGTELGSTLASDDDAILIATFATPEEFERAVGEVMMRRLEIGPQLKWTKRSQDDDPKDARVVEHGWNMMRGVLGIVDATSKSTLGENSFVAGALLQVFLGSTWVTPGSAAADHKRRLESSIAAAKRRGKRDLEVSEAGLDELRAELDARHVELSDLGPVPDHLDLRAATIAATSDATAAAAAHTAELDTALKYGEAERQLESLRADQFALREARATSYFFHSLRPSCCPRCDSDIDQEMFDRESEGKCSLCSHTLPARPQPAAAVSAVSQNPTASVQDLPDIGDEEDQEAAISAQIAEMDALVAQLSAAHDTARDAALKLSDTATASAAHLAQLDRSAAAHRDELETTIARLEGRVEERTSLAVAAGTVDTAADEFSREVLVVAERLAKKERDHEQNASLEIVSEILTTLGPAFGIHNLVRAQLKGNAQLKVTRADGGGPENFGDLSTGERLRLKVALIVGLLTAGSTTGFGRHPGLLIVDDITSHELNTDNAATMFQQLHHVDDLQLIVASTYGPTLRQELGSEHVIGPRAGTNAMF